VATSNVKVRVILVDKDLNQKPVPHLTICWLPIPNIPILHARSKPIWRQRRVPRAPGKYKLTTPQGVDFQGRHYVMGNGNSKLSGEPVSVELSNDNARLTDPPLLNLFAKWTT
jgi:hypothetical protein